MWSSAVGGGDSSGRSKNQYHPKGSADGIKKLDQVDVKQKRGTGKKKRFGGASQQGEVNAIRSKGERGREGDVVWWTTGA